jgi:protein-S-isoprenylcysteine O-methyltransferase Ste14
MYKYSNIFLEISKVNIIVGALSSLGIIILFLGIYINFERAKRQKNIRKKRKSIVETGTMTLFYFFIYFIIVKKIGYYRVENVEVENMIRLLGALSILIGGVLNIIGRLNLGKNWANHIIIYETHTFVTKGLYSIVRHPLYSSIMLMFYGASLAFSNYMVIVLTSIIFIPFMNYRAKQEEEELLKIFPEYKEYKKRVWRFFPKIIRRNK